jgi:hypothetical protein
LDEVGDRAAEASVGRQLNVVAVVQDLHTGWLKQLSQTAQRQPDVRDRRTGGHGEFCQAGLTRCRQAGA